MDVKEFKEKVAEEIETINHVRNRLTLLFNLSGSSLSTKGELEAFADASHRILETDIELLEEVAKILNYLFGNNEVQEQSKADTINDELKSEIVTGLKKYRRIS